MEASQIAENIKLPNYGIDAPGVRKGMFIAGSVGLVLALAATATGRAWEALPAWLVAAVVGVALFIGVYGFFMGCYMTYSSRVGKLRTRETLLDLAAELRPWRGNETVLDVGCGRGLMMVAAARRLTTGQAVGIDLWRAEDQADNSPEAAQANARAEGVGKRVRVDTGDARKLPYPDASFELVLSHWVVHNLDNATDRQRALDEMLRVLRPGGVLVLADIANIDEYRSHLLSTGLKDLRFVSGGAEASIMGVLSGGSFRPQALIGLRP